MDSQPSLEERYNLRGGDRCLYCGSEDIDGTVLYQYGQDRDEEIRCMDCGRSYTIKIRVIETVNVYGDEVNV